MATGGLPPSPSVEPDLSQLSEAERNAILEVIRRDDSLRRKDRQRVVRLKAELQFLRRKGALKAGGELERACARCRCELGRIINRGAFCRACRLRVCKGCREYNLRGTDWVCTVCHKHIEIQVATGEWMNEFIRRPSKRRDNRVYVPTTDVIKRSIKRSWTISNPQRSGARGSPELRSYNTLSTMQRPLRELQRLPGASGDGASSERDPEEEAEDERRAASWTSPDHPRFHPRRGRQLPQVPVVRSSSMSDADNRQHWRGRRVTYHHQPRQNHQLSRLHPEDGQQRSTSRSPCSDRIRPSPSPSLSPSPSPRIPRRVPRDSPSEEESSPAPSPAAFGSLDRPQRRRFLRAQTVVENDPRRRRHVSDEGRSAPGLTTPVPPPRKKSPARKARSESFKAVSDGATSSAEGERGPRPAPTGSEEVENSATDSVPEAAAAMGKKSHSSPEFDVEPLSGTVFRKVAVKKRKQESSSRRKKGGDAEGVAAVMASPMVKRSRRTFFEQFIRHEVKRVVLATKSNKENVPCSSPVKDMFQHPETVPEDSSSSDVPNKEDFEERVSLHHSDISSLILQYHSDTASDIFLDTDKIVPESDDYKLVFISSDSSKESDMSLDYSDQSGPPSRCVSSDDAGCFIDESDWDYFDAGFRRAISPEGVNAAGAMAAVGARTGRSESCPPTSQQQRTGTRPKAATWRGQQSETDSPSPGTEKKARRKKKKGLSASLPRSFLATKEQEEMHSLLPTPADSLVAVPQRTKRSRMAGEVEDSAVEPQSQSGDTTMYTDSRRSSGDRSLEEISFSDHFLPPDDTWFYRQPVLVEISRSLSESDLRDAGGATSAQEDTPRHASDVPPQSQLHSCTLPPPRRRRRMQQLEGTWPRQKKHTLLPSCWWTPLSRVTVECVQNAGPVTLVRVRETKWPSDYSMDRVSSPDQPGLALLFEEWSGDAERQPVSHDSTRGPVDSTNTFEDEERCCSDARDAPVECVNAALLLLPDVAPAADESAEESDGYEGLEGLFEHLCNSSSDSLPGVVVMQKPLSVTVCDSEDTTCGSAEVNMHVREADSPAAAENGGGDVSDAQVINLVDSHELGSMEADTPGPTFQKVDSTKVESPTLQEEESDNEDAKFEYSVELGEFTFISNKQHRSRNSSSSSSLTGSDIEELPSTTSPTPFILNSELGFESDSASSASDTGSEGHNVTRSYQVCWDDVDDAAAAAEEDKGSDSSVASVPTVPTEEMPEVLTSSAQENEVGKELAPSGSHGPSEEKEAGDGDPIPGLAPGSGTVEVEEEVEEGDPPSTPVEIERGKALLPELQTEEVLSDDVSDSGVSSVPDVVPKCDDYSVDLYRGANIAKHVSRFEITRAKTPEVRSVTPDRNSEGVSSGEDKLESDTDSQDTVIEGWAYQELRQFAIRQKIAAANREVSTSPFQEQEGCKVEDIIADASVPSNNKEGLSRSGRADSKSKAYTSCVLITSSCCEEDSNGDNRVTVSVGDPSDLSNVSVVAVSDTAASGVAIVTNSNTILAEESDMGVEEGGTGGRVVVHHTNQAPVGRLSGSGSGVVNLQQLIAQTREASEEVKARRSPLVGEEDTSELANYFTLTLEASVPQKKKQPVMHRKQPGQQESDKVTVTSPAVVDEFGEGSHLTDTESKDESASVVSEDERAGYDHFWETAEESDRSDRSMEEGESNYSESGSSGDEAYFDREEELRGYNNRTIDFTLHTIIEESCEESDSERKPRDNQPKSDPSELEKYFYFDLGGGNSSDPNRNKYANEESEFSDAFSETSSSVYSEGVDCYDKDNEEDPVELASSRLEKYFLTGFLGLDHMEDTQGEVLSDNQTDESGSVGSDSEGQPSPERRRRKVGRTRGQWGTSRASDRTESICSEVSSTSQFEEDGVQRDQMDLSDDTSTASNTSDEVMAFEKGEGQFDTIKRRKKKRSLSETAERKSDCEKAERPRSSDQLDVAAATSASSTVVEEVKDAEPDKSAPSWSPPATPTQNGHSSSETEKERVLSPPLIKVSADGCRSKHQSRDSGFIGSCDDLLSNGHGAVEELVTRQHASSESSGSEGDLVDKKDHHVEVTVASAEIEQLAKDISEATEAASLTRSDSKKSSRSSSIGSADSTISPATLPRTRKLARKDSFNNWSSDEETNLMMNKMRAFFKNMVATAAAAAATTKPVVSCENGAKVKPPQLVYFENELTRLMKTVPDINEDQVREIVEYLSSEDTWSDSYDSSDYTSSDLEGPYAAFHPQFPILHPVPELQEQISASCRQIIRKFDSRNDEGAISPPTIPSRSGKEEESQLNGEAAMVYQMMTSLTRSMGTTTVEEVHHQEDEGTGSPNNSPPLIAKVMHHIGTRLVALMHEVSANSDSISQGSRSSEENGCNSPSRGMMLFEPITSSPKNAGGMLRNRIHRNKYAMAPAVVAEPSNLEEVVSSGEKSSLASTSFESDSPTDTELSPESDEMHAPKSALKHLFSSKAEGVPPDLSGRPLSLLGKPQRIQAQRVGADVSRSLSHESGLWHRLCIEERKETKESLQSSSSGVSDIAEEREGDYFSWKGSFESALAADSRTKLSLEAKRRSAGSDYTRGSGSTSDLCSSSDQLDRAGRVKSCGNILAGSKSSLQLWAEKEAARARPNIVGSSDLISYTGTLSRSRGKDLDSSEFPGQLYGRRRSVPDTVGVRDDQTGVTGGSVGTVEPRSVTLPRSNTTGSASTNSLPRLCLGLSSPITSTSAPSTMQKAQSMVSESMMAPPGMPPPVKSARYRPPGFKPPMSSLSKRALSAPGLALIGRKDHRKMSEDTSMNASKSSILGASPSSAHQSRVSTLGKAGASSKNSSPSLAVSQHHPLIGRGSTSSMVASDWSGPEEDIDRLVAMHQQKSTMSSLGTRSDSMVSVYSAAGEGRYGTVSVRGEVEFGLQYNYKQIALEILVKQCRDLAPVDVKRNRSDPYVKIYLLPDKSKGGKRKTKVKKHTLNPVFDEVLKFQMSLSELETRTLWLTVWHSDMFGRNDFLGEVIMPLAHRVFDDPSPRWYQLQERSEPFDENLSYKGDFVVALKFVPPDAVAAHKKGKRTSRGTLHVLVKEAKNLTPIKASGTTDAFCKSYLLPDKGKNTKQKTSVCKRSCNPSWNHTFAYEDVSLQELHDRALELTLWDHDRLTSNEFLGGVRFNMGTGKYQGKPVDWMDASEKEATLWQSMLERPNFWVEGSLLLRPSMEHRIGS